MDRGKRGAAFYGVQGNWASQGFSGRGFRGKEGLFQGPLRLVTQKSAPAVLQAPPGLDRPTKESEGGRPICFIGLLGREREQKMNESTNTIVPAWKQAGLPGVPFVSEGVHWKRLSDLNRIIRDADCKPVLCEFDPYSLIEIIGDRYGCEAQKVEFVTDPDAVKYYSERGEHPENKYCANVWGIAFVGSKPATISERAGIAALTWQYNRYLPGMRRKSSYTIPADLAEAQKIAGQPSRYSPPWIISSEKQAYRVAKVLDGIFNAKSTVTEFDGGFCLTIEPGSEIECADGMNRLEYVLMALDQANYDDSVMSPREAELPGDADRFSRYITERADHIMRIEAKLDTLLARLPAAPQGDADTAKLKAKAASLVESVEEHHQDARKDKHTTGVVKSSSKRSA